MPYPDDSATHPPQMTPTQSVRYAVDVMAGSSVVIGHYFTQDRVRYGRLRLPATFFEATSHPHLKYQAWGRIGRCQCGVLYLWTVESGTISSKTSCTSCGSLVDSYCRTEPINLRAPVVRPFIWQNWYKTSNGDLVWPRSPFDVGYGKVPEGRKIKGAIRKATG